MPATDLEENTFLNKRNSFQYCLNLKPSFYAFLAECMLEDSKVHLWSTDITLWSINTAGLQNSTSPFIMKGRLVHLPDF